MLGIYCRTSKNRADKYTIDNQREAGINCAQKLNIGYRIYVDDGISGTLDESVRDGLSDLFRDIKKKEVTHVYCIDQSRIERNSRTWDFFVAQCLNNGIKYYPGGALYELDNDTNRMTARLMSVVNAYYAEITSKKVRLANARKAREGKTHGLKPYGYKKGKNNTYEIYEQEAVNVRRMFEMSLKGIGAYTIANTFNNERIPTKFSGNFTGEITRKDKYTKVKTTFKKAKVMWRGNVISDMLRNKMYKGIREWQRHEDIIKYENGQQVKQKIPVELIIYNDIPAIVKPKIWDAVNANFENNKKNVGKKEQYHYLLNGLVFCGHCTNEVLGKKRLKGNDNAYKCKGKRPPQKTCTESRGISLPKLETFIVQHLFHSKELKSLLINAPKNGDQIARLKRDIENLKSEQEETSRQVNRLSTLLKRPELEDDKAFVEDYLVKKKKLAGIESKILLLANKIAESESESRKRRTRTIIESYSEQVGFDELKRLIHLLIDKITIYHHKKLKGGWFNIIIKYRNFEEYSTFITDWAAMKWIWVNHQRNQPLNSEDFEEDYELAEYIAKRAGVKAPAKSTFKGFQTISSRHEAITLDSLHLITYD